MSALPQKRNGKPARARLITATIGLTDRPLTLPSGNRRLTRGLRMTPGLVLKIAFWRRLLRDRRSVPDSGDLRVALYFSVSACHAPGMFVAFAAIFPMDCFFACADGRAGTTTQFKWRPCCATGRRSTSHSGH